MEKNKIVSQTRNKSVQKYKRRNETKEGCKITDNQGQLRRKEKNILGRWKNH
jgi:hypothetical protein